MNSYWSVIRGVLPGADHHRDALIKVKRPDWEREYSRGDWDYLNNISESSRYSVISGFIRCLGPDQSILDLGCGTGLLPAYLGSNNYARYTGIDISEAAIECARQSEDEHTRFLVADLTQVTLKTRYDVIVCSECLYYLPDPVAVLLGYSQFVAPCGVIITSLFLGSRRFTPTSFYLRLRNTRLAKQMKKHFSCVEEVLIKSTRASWLCNVFIQAGHDMRAQFKFRPEFTQTKVDG